MQNLTIGSHIKTARTVYSHHGIYCGNGKVVHYSGFAEAFKKGKLEITTLAAFLGSETKYYVIEYPSDKVKFSSKEIIRRALSRVGEDSYNIVFNNCEHFAAWCVTGKSESKQVRTVLSSTTVVAVTYKSIGTVSAATRIVGLTAGSAKVLTGTTAASSFGIGRLAGCTTGAIGGAVIGSSGTIMGTTALVGTSSAIAGTSTALGFSALTLGGGALTVAAAPAIIPIAVAVGACAVIGGIVGAFFD